MQGWSKAQEVLLTSAGSDPDPGVSWLGIGIAKAAGNLLFVSAGLGLAVENGRGPNRKAETYSARREKESGFRIIHT